ncbi:metal ABC transporter substrate-binding protein [Yinghuangia aomiensis]
MPPVSFTALAAVLALLLTACGAKDDAGSSNRQRLGARGRRVLPPEVRSHSRSAGPEVRVTNLTKPGAEPNWSCSAKQVGGRRRCGCDGVPEEPLQPAVDKAVLAGEAGPRQLEASELSPLEEHGDEVDGHSGHDHGGGDGHDHSAESGGDPHIWLDPTRLATVAVGVGETLAEADPAHGADYRARAADLKTRLDGLDNEFRTGLARAANATSS